MDDDLVTDTFGEVPAPTPEFDPTLVDVPTTLGVLPDGSDTVVIGDVDELAELNHDQGDNPYGYLGTCGLVSCEQVLGQFGIEVSEEDMIRYAAQNDLCNISDDPATAGGTTPDQRVEILNDFGIPAHVEPAQSLEDLAAHVEAGSGVIIGANAGVLWDDAAYYDAGQSNHAVVVTGVARDPETGDLQGFFINDSGSGQSGQFVDASTMGDAWLEAPGASLIATDVVRPGSADQAQ